MLLLIVGLAFAPAPLWAAKDSPFDDLVVVGTKDRYQRCVNLVKHDAQGAYREAQSWQNTGGGAAADHCAALALVQLKRYGDAARRLDALAQGTGMSGKMRAQLYDQAGNVWLLAGQAQNAVLSLSAALALSAHDADVLADRAQAKAMLKDWAGADADLSAALERDSNRADLLVLRASARHAEGRKAEARTDIDRALGIYPNYPDALIERGAMKYDNADKAGARSDWQLAVKLAPNTEAGTTARGYLAGMDAAQPPPIKK